MGGGGDVYEVAQCSLVGRKRGEEELRQTEDCGGRTDRISFAIIHLLYCFQMHALLQKVVRVAGAGDQQHLGAGSH